MGAPKHMSETQSTRHSTVLDSDSQQVGELYGRAILAAAGGDGEEIVAQLNGIVGECLEAFPNLESVLSSPRIGQVEKEAIIDRIFRGRVNDKLLNFLKVLCRRGRIGSLRAVQSRTSELFDEKSGRIRLLVTTPVPLDDQQRQQIADAVGATLGKSVKIDERVDPKLLGGLLLRIGDQVYDGSILGKINGLRTSVSSGIQKAIREQVSSLLSP
jgi:F-type H+-transporting ATPase subunit delta